MDSGGVVEFDGAESNTNGTKAKEKPNRDLMLSAKCKDVQTSNSKSLM